MKLPPASTYASSTDSDALWSVVQPNVLPPRHSAATFIPVRPSARINMFALLGHYSNAPGPRSGGHATPVDLAVTDPRHREGGPCTLQVPGPSVPTETVVT